MEQSQNAFYYDALPNLNQFATKGSDFEKVTIQKNPQIIVKINTVNITKTDLSLTIKGFEFAPKILLLNNMGQLNAPASAQIADSNVHAYTLTPSWRKVTNADYYEILFNQQLYSTITDTTLLFDELTPETNYNFQLRSVNKSGHSDWVSFSAKTKANPLENALKGITATCNVSSYAGHSAYSIAKLFDMDEKNMWQTKTIGKDTVLEILADLHSTNQLDKMEYLPREKGNGIWLKGTVYYSLDKKEWAKADNFEWANNGTTKTFNFTNHPTARYIKIEVKQTVGAFGSGRELYIFKVPGTESVIPGDINNDHIIDLNDLTSYINYTGLRKGDGDFEGYVSKGDINKNDLIDVYDISNVATRLDGGADLSRRDSVAGQLDISPNKQDYKSGEEVIITVKGKNLNAVNGLSFALPYDPSALEYQGLNIIGMKYMENMTIDRLHSNGQKALYPTFVNIGDQESLQDSPTLFQIKFKAKKDYHYNLKPKDGLLVDVHLHTIAF